MRGTIIKIKIDGSTFASELFRPIELADLREAVGGYIEVVPFFDTIAYNGTVMNCVAFCNEEGKLNALSVNNAATDVWRRALKRNGQYFDDWLAGDVAVVFGDAEFMRTL